MKCSFIIQVHIYLICQLRQLSELRRTKFLVLNKFSYKFSSKIYFVFFSWFVKHLQMIRKLINKAVFLMVQGFKKRKGSFNKVD